MPLRIVNNNITGKELTTTAPVDEGELIYVFSQQVDDRTRHTIECDGKHFLDNKIMYVNHSCDPNCEVMDNGLWAIKDITPLTPLTFDYNETESEISSPFECLCGSINCRGRVE